MQDLRGPWADIRDFAAWSEACSVYEWWSKNLGPASKKIWGGEKHAKFGPILDLSHFEREYLRNGQRYPKPENYLTDSISSCVGWKKFGELWSTNHGDLEVQLYPENRVFWNTIFHPLGGAVPQNFYTHYRMSMSC